jgi:hypothetical protein
VLDTNAGERLDRHAGLAQRRFGTGHRRERDERIIGAVDQQHRRTRAQFTCQQLGGDQPAGIAENAGQRFGAAQPDEQRHHRALREPDQRGIAVAQTAFGEFLVDKGVERRRGGAHPGQHRARRAVLHTEPLIAVGGHVARERRIRRDELGRGQQPSPILLQPNQIVAIGSETVQQDHELARSAAGKRQARRAGKRHQHRETLGIARASSLEVEPCSREGGNQGCQHTPARAPLAQGRRGCFR